MYTGRFRGRNPVEGGENCNIRKIRVSNYRRSARELDMEGIGPGVQRYWTWAIVEERGQKSIGNGFGPN